MRRWLWWLWLCGCGTEASGGADDGTPVESRDATVGEAPDAGAPDGPVYLGCNVVAAPCALPFPSSVLSRHDGASVRVDLAGADFGGLWAQLGSEAYDGFSPVGPIVTRLPGAPVADVLPFEGDAADAPVRVFRIDDGARVPVRVEEVRSGDEALLVITPLRPLERTTRYGVVVTDGLLDPATRTAGMTALMGATPAAPPLDALWRAYQRIWATVEGPLGIDRARVVQLWDFHTRSQDGIARDFEEMAAQTQAWIAAHPQRPVPVAKGRAGSRARYEIEVEVPLWRTERGARLHRDDAGRPAPVGTERLRGIVIVPDAATPDAPAYPLIFGHGLAASAELMSRLMEAMELERGPFAVVLFDWDLHGTRGRGTEDIGAIAGALDTPAFATSMLQSAADSLVFTAVAASLGDFPDRGRVVRAAPPVYLGQSLGGLIGAIGATRNPGLRAAALNVTGGGLATVLRSGRVLDVLRLRDRIAGALDEAPLEGLPDELAIVVLVAMAQLGLDAGDPLAHVGPPAMPTLVQASIGDGIMPNLATEALARAFDLPLVEPALREVPGLERATAPTGGAPASGLTQFRVSTDDFQAHLALNTAPVQRQAMVWLASFVDAAAPDGDITYDCPDADCDLTDD